LHLEQRDLHNKSSEVCSKTRDAFHSMKNPDISSDMTNVTTFCAIKKKKNLAMYTEICRIFLPEISIPFDFPTGISEIFG